MIASSWHAGLLALLSVMLLVPLVRVISARFNLYDPPGPLKIHLRPIPRLGGIAIALAFAAGAVAARGPIPRAGWFLLGALILVWLAGLLDDARGLHPANRFAAQIIAALLLWLGGWQIPIFASAAWNLVATCLFVVFFVNAFNFLDGADGLASGVAALTAIGYIVIPAGMQTELGGTIAWTLLGACIGFLVFNFPPASIFLGDSGSTLLGFSAAFLGLDLYRAGITTTAKSALLFPLLVSAIPLVDASLAVLRRLRLKSSPFQGDRQHFYDLLLARGWSTRSVALTTYGLAAGLVVVASIAMRMGYSHALFASALIFGGLVAAALRLGSLRSDQSVPNKPATVKLPWPRHWLSARRVRQKI
jgi:UDP-GlcNAc:undecaprenyl-phosphate GlcNAc-1-phosphate transferase